MKKVYLFMSIFALFLSGCGNVGTDEVTDDAEETNETFITLDNFNLDNYSKMIVSEESHENGTIIGSSTDDGLDASQFESNLMRIGKERFGEDVYLLANNSILTESEELEDLFANHSINILTYNYFDQVSSSEISLSGMLVGIQVSSTYSGNALSSTLNTVSQTILDIIRTDYDVPVVFAVFQQQPRGSRLPGNFILKNEIGGETTSIGDWTNLNEEFFLFPSTDLASAHSADANELGNFMSDLRNAFSSSGFLGDSGLLLYRDNELSKITLTININFSSTTEVIALTQKIGELLEGNDFFSNVDTQITIVSTAGTEALIAKGVNDEDVFTHIYN